MNCNLNNDSLDKDSLDNHIEIIEDTLLLPGIVSSKTAYFDDGKIYYQAMDEQGQESFKCLSLTNKQLLWSKSINHMGINKGAITSTREYVAPTLSDSVYLIDTTGNVRILNLEDRCKINPLVYKNTFILQDRGVGLKCFDAKTLQQQWFIPQKKGGATMSQPLLIDSSIIYILDDEYLQSSDAKNGKLNWSVRIEDSLSIQILYGMYNNLVFVLGTDLEKSHFITAFDKFTGNQIWKEKVDSTIEVWQTSMVVANEKLFCRGDHSIFVYAVENGSKLKTYNYKSRIGTNLIVNKNGDVLFGLNNDTLMKINKRDNDFPIFISKEGIGYLYSYKGGSFFYSYPNLYSLKTGHVPL